MFIRKRSRLEASVQVPYRMLAERGKGIFFRGNESLAIDFVIRPVCLLTRRPAVKAKLAAAARKFSTGCTTMGTCM